MCGDEENWIVKQDCEFKWLVKGNMTYLIPSEGSLEGQKSKIDKIWRDKGIEGGS